jgi:actin related protein 2/3 complex, subunit 1A/1B
MLPYVTLTWTGEDALVAAGHDCQPVLYSGTASGWKLIGSLDDVNGPRSSSFPSTTSSPRTAVGAGGGGGPPVGRLNNAAFNRFKDADSRGTSSIPGTPSSPGGGGLFGGASGVSGGELMTVHQNTITSVRPYEWGANGTVTKVSTTGVDGKLVIWNVSAAAGLAPKLAGGHLR